MPSSTALFEVASHQSYYGWGWSKKEPILLPETPSRRRRRGIHKTTPLATQPVTIKPVVLPADEIDVERFRNIETAGDM